MFINKGDLVISSKPFAFALFQSERDFRCDQCFKLLRTRISCYKCLKVMFCSHKCQSESIEQGLHEHECALLARRPLSCLTRLVARIIKKLQNKQNQNQVEIVGTHERGWNCLMDHYENIVKDPNVMFEFEKIYEDLLLIFDDSLLDIKAVISIYGKLLINSFAVQDELMRQIGRAIYLGPSILDHSCKPSLNFLFIGTTIYIKAIESVPINDITDLRISYIDEFETTEERQRQLTTSYYFQCDCQRCNSDENPVVSMMEDKRLRPICEKIEHLTQQNHSLFNLIERTGSSAQKRLHQSCIQNDNNMISEFVSQLKTDPMSLNTVLEVIIAEFVAIHTKDIELWQKVINIMRSYYGQCHQRLACKLFVLTKNCDKYPALKRKLLTEAKTIANIITPDFKHYATNCNFSRSRAINKYSEHKVISDSLIDSTLLYLIESELIDKSYSTNYKFIQNVNINQYKQRSRSHVTDSRTKRTFIYPFNHKFKYY